MPVRAPSPSAEAVGEYIIRNKRADIPPNPDLSNFSAAPLPPNFGAFARARPIGARFGRCFSERFRAWGVATKFFRKSLQKHATFLKIAESFLTINTIGKI